jgi:ketosteroid isomerase-like protein
MRHLLAAAVFGSAALALAAPAEKPKILTLAPKEGTRLPPHEQMGAQAKADLAAVYDTFAAAIEKGDVEPFLRVRRPDYTEVAADGATLDAKRAADALSAWLEALKRPAKVAYGVGKVDVQQEAVTALVGRRVTTREVIDGKSVEVEVVTQRLETWLRGSEGWRLRHAGAEAVVQRLVDGMVVPEN